jgi:diacylglycerol kinase family enzyme
VNASALAIINGRAGGLGEGQARDELRSLLEGALPSVDVVFTDESTDVAGLARAAVARGATLIIAGGGDGTINAVASAVAGTATVLGLMPLGTLNHFAKDLGIPASPADAARVLADGRTQRVDVGEVNGRIFVNNSGLGLYPATVRLREQRQRHGASKWPAFAWAAAKALARYRRLRIRLTIDGQALVRRTPIVFVGNNRYEMEGLRAGTRAAVDGGELCLYIPQPRGRWHLVWFSILALLGRAYDREDFDAFYSDAFTIESGHAHELVSIDGEVTRLTTPLTYRIRKGALHVMVPLLASVAAAVA